MLYSPRYYCNWGGNSCVIYMVYFLTYFSSSNLLQASEPLFNSALCFHYHIRDHIYPSPVPRSIEVLFKS